MVRAGLGAVRDLAAGMTDRPMASRRVRLLAAIVCATLWAAALTATHVPISQLPNLPTGDKALHGTGYFVLASVFAATLAIHGLPLRRRSTVVLIVMPLYGAFDEATQPMFGRSASWGDYFVDMLGTLLAVIMCVMILWVWVRIRPSPGPGMEDK